MREKRNIQIGCDMIKVWWELFIDNLIAKDFVILYETKMYKNEIEKKHQILHNVNVYWFKAEYLFIDISKATIHWQINVPKSMLLFEIEAVTIYTAHCAVVFVHRDAW